MKQTKKLLSFVLVLALSLSLTGGMSAKAAATVTVTLRLEQDGATLLPPVSVTLTEADKNNDFGIGLPTGPDAAQSPARAYAKYLSSEKGVSNDEMKKYIIASQSEYGLFVNGFSTTGDGIGSASVKEDVKDVYWKYNVNDAEGPVSIAEYDLKDSDSVVIYGLWWSEKDETLYSAFDKSAYETENNSVTVTLTGYGTSYDENFNPTPYTKPVAGAKISVALVTPDQAPVVPEGNAALSSETSADGTATITFPQSDKDETYVLTASKYAADGVHNTISRPYALVKVPAKISNSKPAKITKPAKVKSVKAVVKKSKKAKKTIALSWKKVSNADGYQLYVSTKKKTGYKKTADVKKSSAKIKRKKGTYYIKVRSYKKSEGKKISGSFSNICRVKVK